jgi:serine phosphatase RsbU (regulator of sigma subunit)
MPPNLVLKLFNNLFVDDKKGLTIFFNCAIVDIDLDKNELYYSAAGHPYQFLKNNKGINTLKTRDFMVGVRANKEFELYTYSFNPGDKLILFTDGIFEINNKIKSEIRMENIEHVFIQNQDKSISEIMENITSNHNSWVKNNPMDDTTLIGVECKT